LSVLQCLKPGFVDHICGIVEEYDVDKKTINFEITESVAASDYEMLSVVVSDLKKHGFRFAMDDYGTGYSNMQSIFSLDFDIVKIDKSLLWGAEETELGRIILGNSIKTIDQMGRRILVEGVETKEQLEMLKELSVDYLQGFYFSKPIPQNEFIEYIKKEK
jgi:EAL domain-containing protein (putative c-di-GMP-specific phosphodiesterase class I)